MTTPFTKAAVLEILRTPQSLDTFPDMIRRVEALEGCGVRVSDVPVAVLAAAMLASDEDHNPESWFAHWGGTVAAWGDDPDPEIRARHKDAMKRAVSMCRILAAMEPVAQPETPTPGQFTTMCLAIEDVVTWRGFDVTIPEAVKAYMRNVLMVGGWKGERE